MEWLDMLDVYMYDHTSVKERYETMYNGLSIKIKLMILFFSFTVP